MISVDANPIDPSALLAAFTKSADCAGAVASFIGLARADDDVEAVVLEHCPGLTEREIARALEAARARWSLIDVLAVHRVGRIATGEPIVLVATAAKHRRQAFEACDFLMDYLKTDAPFWKKEIVSDAVRWIEPRTEDYRDRERWTQNARR